MNGSYRIEPALASDEAEIENLLDRAFGIGRRTKTSYRLREGNRAVAGLSLVIREAGLGIVGTVSFWPLRIGAAGTPALLLGPLAVHPGIVPDVAAVPLSSSTGRSLRTWWEENRRISSRHVLRCRARRGGGRRRETPRTPDPGAAHHRPPTACCGGAGQPKRPEM